MDAVPDVDPARTMTQILTIKSNQPQKAVSLTEMAVVKVRELIQAEGEPGLALRVAVRPGGCSGFSYEMFFDTDIESDDIVEEFGDGVRVVVDPQSVERLRGSTLDYKDGLMGAGFAIDNPNVTRSCGCGNSFS
jgi:iron-sulfur cluster assembly protein/iron-sulfur cluster insertion protein